MLLVRSVAVRLGGRVVLDGVSVEASAAEAVAVIGPNGSGKSTLLNTIMGLVRPCHGTIMLDGVDISGALTERIVQLGLVMVPEGRRVFPRMTVLENLRIAAEASGRGKGTEDEYEGMLALFPVLRHRLRSLAGNLSGGEQQMLAFARGMMSRPRVLLLDEPTLGLDACARHALYSAVRVAVGAGVGVLVAEQNVGELLDVASRGYLLEDGTISLAGTAQELKADTRVARQYLGMYR